MAERAEPAEATTAHGGGAARIGAASPSRAPVLEADCEDLLAATALSPMASLPDAADAAAAATFDADVFPRKRRRLARRPSSLPPLEDPSDPPGPKTADETFSWPLDYAARMAADPAEDFWAEVTRKVVDVGVTLTSGYTGSKALETAGEWVAKAVELTAGAGAAHAKIPAAQGSDYDPVCQEIMLEHGARSAAASAGRGAQPSDCVFGDQLQRTWPEHAEAWAKLVEQARQREATLEAQGAGEESGKSGGGRGA
jgi:hypothetical protein